MNFAVSSNAPDGTRIHTVLSGWVIFAYTCLGVFALLFTCIGSYCFVTRCCCKKFRKKNTNYRTRRSRSFLEDSDSPASSPKIKIVSHAKKVSFEKYEEPEEINKEQIYTITNSASYKTQ